MDNLFFIWGQYVISLGILEVGVDKCPFYPPVIHQPNTCYPLSFDVEKSQETPEAL